MIVETEKQRKALQSATESGKQEGVQGVWGFKYTIFTGPLNHAASPCDMCVCVCVCVRSLPAHRRVWSQQWKVWLMQTSCDLCIWQMCMCQGVSM